MNQQEISFYEELQCNAFPALQNVMYDGWSVRFGGGFTYRVNCANAMYPEALPAKEKVQYVESLYRQSGLSMSIFKLHEGMDPAQCKACNAVLDEMGYATERDGNIFVCDLKTFDQKPATQVVVSGDMTDEWLEGFLTMNGTIDAQRPAASAMLKSIHYPIAAASIVAKVERDALMCEYARQYPEYDFSSNKGYASAAHIQAIKDHGLSPIHRASFCHAFTQESLF